MPTCLPVGCSPPWAPSPPNIAEYSPKVPQTLLLFWLKVRNDNLGLQKWGRRLSPSCGHEPRVQGDAPGPCPSPFLTGFSVSPPLGSSATTNAPKRPLRATC